MSATPMLPYVAYGTCGRPESNWRFLIGSQACFRNISTALAGRDATSFSPPEHQVALLPRTFAEVMTSVWLDVLSPIGQAQAASTTPEPFEVCSTT